MFNSGNSVAILLVALLIIQPGLHSSTYIKITKELTIILLAILLTATVTSMEGQQQLL